MDLQNVSKEMWVAWKNDPVTKEFLAMIKAEREGAKEAVVQGRWKGDELNQVIGFCVGLNVVLNVEFTEDTKDAESDSVESNSQA